MIICWKYMAKAPLTENEVASSIMSSNSNSAPGPDRILNGHLKVTLHLLLPMWTILYNVIFSSGSLPDNWHKSIVKVLFKGKGQVTDTGAYRGITLKSCIYKAFSRMITWRLYRFFGIKERIWQSSTWFSQRALYCHSYPEFSRHHSSQKASVCCIYRSADGF